MITMGTIVAGFCYGACLSVFPATTANLFGVKNLGINYGLVFAAWGAGGVFGGLIGGQVRDLTGTYLSAYLIAAVLCLAGAALAFLIKPLPSTAALPQEQIKRRYGEKKGVLKREY
ncbi:MAG: MFS transporter [Bacillota bacterium]|nr:MFS transporter [Bacillota bacterium]